jgi:hypothetical protein
VQYWERHNGDRPGTDHSAAICTHEMYIILNTAVQANPLPPTEPDHYPVEHLVDWVRVWEWTETESTETINPTATTDTDTGKN